MECWKKSSDKTFTCFQHHHVSIESASSASSTNKTSDQQEIFGPVLPPGLENKGNKATDIAVGPALPPGWNRERNSDSEGGIPYL